ncbi:MAG: hypothetical protein U0517_01500 [Candidatus Andersenbacteria bacterium]
MRTTKATTTAGVPVTTSVSGDPTLLAALLDNKEPVEIRLEIVNGRPFYHILRKIGPDEDQAAAREEVIAGDPDKPVSIVIERGSGDQERSITISFTVTSDAAGLYQINIRVPNFSGSLPPITTSLPLKVNEAAATVSAIANDVENDITDIDMAWVEQGLQNAKLNLKTLELRQDPAKGEVVILYGTGFSQKKLFGLIPVRHRTQVTIETQGAQRLLEFEGFFFRRILKYFLW